MGTDENQTFNINVEKGGNAQLNVAQDNATINALQDNGADTQRLEKVLKDLIDNAIDLSNIDRQDVIDSTDIIKDEMHSIKPRKNVIKMAFNRIKMIGDKIPDSVGFIAAIA